MISDENSQLSELDEEGTDEANVWKNKYIRLLADLKNTQNRLALSSAREVVEEKKSILRDVLPVVDGMDLALMHLSREEDSRDILSGIEMIQNILEQFLTKHDVEMIDAWGKPFDPTLHEAVGVIPHSDLPPNTVASVEQKGYLYRGALLRPARVMVVSSR